MEALFFLVFGLVFLGIIFLGIYAIGANKKRAEDLSRCASAMQLAYSRVAPEGFSDDLAKMSFFAVPANRNYTNVMHGQAGGMRVHIFEYNVSQDSAPVSHAGPIHPGNDAAAMTHSHTSTSSSSSLYSAVYLRGNSTLPQFLLFPSSVMDGIVKKLFGMQDINFDSHPVFSKEWVLQGKDEAAVRKLFGPEVLTHLERKSKDTVAGEGERLVLLRPGFLMPEQVEGLLKDALALNEVLRRNAG
jgi:hypothetical protein